MGALGGVVYPDIFQVTDLLAPMMRVMRRRCSLTPETHSWQHLQVGVAGHCIGSNDKQNLHMFLDGTIHNAEALHKDLKRRGHQFSDAKQANLLVHAYQAYGLDFVQHIDGDFAIAIVDESRNQLILIRDRLGRKPLYWYEDANHFLFASELPALLATGAVPQTAAIDALSAYLSLGYMPQDMAAIEGVNKLLPGHYLVLSPNQHKNIRQYWSYSDCFTRPCKDATDDIPQHLDTLLDHAVKARMPAAASSGCFVSGGLGSAAIAAHIARQHSVQGYTAGFTPDNDSDIAASKMIADKLQIQQHIDLIGPESALDDLVKAIWHLGEPIADPTVLATYRLCRLAAENTQTVFSGMGCDELLGGHQRYAVPEEKDPAKSWLQGFLQPIERKLLVPLLNRMHRGIALQLVRNLGMNPWQARYLQANSLFNRKALASAAPALAPLFDAKIFLQRFHQLGKIQSTLSSFLYFDVKTRLPDCYLLQYDRFTTGFGLQWETPFLTKDIVEYLATIRAGHPLPKTFQNILRPEWINDILPKPKELRPHFLASWADHPKVYESFNLLLQGTCVDTGLISETWLREQLKDPHARRMAFLQLWAVLVLEVWLRLFVTKPIRMNVPDITLKALLTGT